MRKRVLTPPRFIGCGGTLAAILLLGAHLFAQSTSLLVDVDHRAATSLDGPWHAIIDPYGNGLYKAPSINKGSN